MVTINKVDRSFMDKPRAARVRKINPEVEKQLGQFRRLVAKLTGPEDVFQITLEGTEKPVTVRQRLLKVAKEARVEIAVRKHGQGFVVGLLTPDRRTNRGRRGAAKPGA
jgi:hypothetical protein